MPPSEKPPVIEWIFFNLKLDSATGEVADPVVTFEDIVRGIQETGVKLKTNNPANFWKDLTRHGTLNRNWPQSIFEAGWTGADAIGEGEQAVFKFVPVLPDQAEAVPETIAFLPETVPTHRVQSLSMPQATKALGRTDENWLAQVAARLAVVDTFFALFSPRDVKEVTFLQTGVKLKKGEVDAAFSVNTDDGRWLVSAEAKGRGEKVHAPQIARAAHNLDAMVRGRGGELSDVLGVIPMAIKIVGPSAIWIVEFEPVETADSPLVIAAQAVIELVPAVEGIR